MIYRTVCIFCIIFSVFDRSSQEDGTDILAKSINTYNVLQEADSERWCSDHCQQAGSTLSDTCQATCVQTVEKLRAAPKKWTDDTLLVNQDRSSGGGLHVAACVRSLCLPLRGEARKRCLVSCGHKDGIRKRWLDPLNYGVTQKRAESSPLHQHAATAAAEDFMVCLRTFCNQGLSDTCSTMCKRDGEGKVSAHGYPRARRGWMDTTYMCKLFCYGEATVMTFDGCVHRCAYTIGKSYRNEK